MKRAWFSRRPKISTKKPKVGGMPGGRPTPDTQLIPSDDQPIRLGKRMAGLK